MQSMKEIAYQKLIRFYGGLVALTGLGSVLMALSPSMPPCSQAIGSSGGAPVAYLCSTAGATYIFQMMVYALGLSLGCLVLVLVMRSAAQRQS